MASIAAEDDNFIHIKAFDLPQQEKKIVLDTEGVVQQGELIKIDTRTGEYVSRAKES